jgi:drug/metabolite transporter (DMT)-like permease
MTNVGGFQFAPLAHGTVILPATFTVAGILLSTWLFGERLTAPRAIGTAIVIAGLVTIAGAGLLHLEARTIVGDAMFASAALMWAAATMLVKRWTISPMQTSASVAVVSATLVVPAYLLVGTPQHLVTTPLPTVLFQVLVNGVLAGVFAVLAFTRSVELLGPQRAGLLRVMGTPQPGPLLRRRRPCKVPDRAQSWGRITGRIQITGGPKNGGRSCGCAGTRSSRLGSPLRARAT